MEVAKELVDVWIPIPCIDGFGSCEYDDVCSELNLIQQCPKILTDTGFMCTCDSLKEVQCILLTCFVILLKIER